MLRRTTALAVSALATTALFGASPGRASGETCQGRPATIIGTGPEVKGTSGDDVIVTGASRSVWAGDGGDLVCVTPSPPEEPITVWVEAGDDVVDTSASTSERTWTDLGTGVDRYLGGPSDDEVHAANTAADVSGGEGDDSVVLHLTSMVGSVPGRYDGGGGRNAISVRSQTLDVDLHLDEQLLVAGLLAADLANFDSGLAYAPNLTLRGNAGDNSLRFWGCHVQVWGKDGDDHISARYIDDDRPTFDHCRDDREARVDGGQGDDEIDGTTGPDRLVGNAGQDVLRGYSGDDVLLGGAGDDRLDGVGGRDLLRGDGGNDILLGSRGRDAADGRRGRDRCVAEVERRCER
jgi:Ca2+-binding RTX toxin-like protein